MSNDLTQYFTTNVTKEITEEDISINAILAIEQNMLTKDSAINDMLDDPSGWHYLDNVIEGYIEDINIHLYQDAAGEDIYDNILNCFMERGTFILHEFECTMDQLFNYETSEFEDTLLMRWPGMNNQVKKSFMKGYMIAMVDCNKCNYEMSQKYSDTDFIYDEYSASVVAIRMKRIQFIDKAVGRKIKKLYAKDYCFKRMMNSLGFTIVGGQLINWWVVNMEEMGFWDSDESVLLDIIAAIESTRNLYTKYKKNDISNIMDFLIEMKEVNCSASIVYKLNDTLSTNNEVMM